MLQELPKCAKNCPKTVGLPSQKITKSKNPQDTSAILYPSDEQELAPKDRCKTWCDLVGSSCIQNCGLNILCLASCLFQTIPNCPSTCPQPSPPSPPEPPRVSFSFQNGSSYFTKNNPSMEILQPPPREKQSFRKIERILALGM